MTSEGHVTPDRAMLDALSFLVGRFRGAGSFIGCRTLVDKESTGSWEVSRCFLALRMAATYRIGESETDAHEALVLAGVNPHTRVIEARAYLDSGGTWDYRLDLDGVRVSFDDRVPHEVKAARARKLLVPTADGYDEILEIDRGDGRLEPYSVLEMKRV
ncbi:MAG: hypothetical protein QOD06_2468 [Candidatus Binatota bacterium]|jgi:hypothetical protein|nr:hypothetical protein [Candidatus Binatota bacterium]